MAIITSIRCFHEIKKGGPGLWWTQKIPEMKCSSQLQKVISKKISRHFFLKSLGWMKYTVCGCTDFWRHKVEFISSKKKKKKTWFLRRLSLLNIRSLSQHLKKRTVWSKFLAPRCYFHFANFIFAHLSFDYSLCFKDYLQFLLSLCCDFRDSVIDFALCVSRKDSRGYRWIIRD